MNANDDDDDFLYGGNAPETGPEQEPVKEAEPSNAPPPDNADEEEEDMEEEDSEDDIEIITDGPVPAPIKHSIDYRPQAAVNRTSNYSAPQSTLTTEYKPLERETKKLAVSPAVAQPPVQELATKPQESTSNEPQVDPSTLPVARAPASAPKIELDKDGLLDGRSIYDVDIAALESKAWRRPGADLSDWFNYGFDEISWEAYAARRKQLGDMAPILKANVLTLSGMTEEQVLNMPSDLRGMVMMSSNLAANNMGNMNAPNMMPNPGGMHPDMMMNMGMMGNMPGGPDMSAAGQQGMMQPMEPDMSQSGMMQGMDFQGGNMNQGMDYQESTPVQAPPSGGGFSMEGVPSGPSRGVPFKARPPSTATPPTAPRARASTAARGRGLAPPTGPRAASPLPPNVPTGPRGQHRYKDRDTGAPGSEPLDYGGDGYSRSSDRGRGDEFGRDMDRSRDDDSKSGKRRRASPAEDSGR